MHITEKLQFTVVSTKTVTISISQFYNSVYPTIKNMPDYYEPIDELDRLTSSVHKTSKDQLVHSIQTLLTRCTGVPVSELIPLLQPACPHIGEEVHPQSTFLHDCLMELLCKKLLNMETWFIDETKAELYLLVCPIIDDEDLVRPSRLFSTQVFPHYSEFDVEICTEHVGSKQFYFYLKSFDKESRIHSGVSILNALHKDMHSVYGGRSLSAISSDSSESNDLEASFDASAEVASCPPLLPTLAPGVLCAVSYQNKWVRGQIVSVDQRGVKIELVDLGQNIIISLPTNKLRILEKQFKSLPRTALKAYFDISRMTLEDVNKARLLLQSNSTWCCRVVHSSKATKLCKDHSSVAGISSTHKLCEYSLMATVTPDFDNKMASELMVQFTPFYNPCS